MTPLGAGARKAEGRPVPLHPPPRAPAETCLPGGPAPHARPAAPPSAGHLSWDPPSQDPARRPASRPWEHLARGPRHGMRLLSLLAGRARSPRPGGPGVGLKGLLGDSRPARPGPPEEVPRPQAEAGPTSGLDSRAPGMSATTRWPLPPEGGRTCPGGSAEGGRARRPTAQEGPTPRGGPGVTASASPQEARRRPGAPGFRPILQMRLVRPEGGPRSPEELPAVGHQSDLKKQNVPPGLRWGHKELLRGLPASPRPPSPAPQVLP